MIAWMNRHHRPRPPGIVLLDRDGVINRDRPDYVKTPDEFVLYPEAAAAIARLNENGFAVAVVSNQSGLGRGIIDWEDFVDIHLKMIRSIGHQGGEIGAAFYCPHRPETDCECRKPKPALLLEAAEIFETNIGAAVMIGDRMSDIEAARRAGCRSILLKRGEPEWEARRGPRAAGRIMICEDLLSATESAMRCIARGNGDENSD